MGGQGNPNIAEYGKNTRIGPGRKLPGPIRKPALDLVRKQLLEDEKLERRVAERWIADLEDHEPEFRHNVRRDLMDRINGKAAQSVEITMPDPEPDAELGGVDAW